MDCDGFLVNAFDPPIRICGMLESNPNVNDSVLEACSLKKLDNVNVTKYVPADTVEESIVNFELILDPETDAKYFWILLADEAESFDDTDHDTYSQSLPPLPLLPVGSMLMLEHPLIELGIFNSTVGIIGLYADKTAIDCADA